MSVKVGRRTEKRYGLILTCLSTRAIHVELLDSMNTDSAILALRRFVSLRGQPVCLYSDNGSNFRGADNELKRAWREIKMDKIQTKFATGRTSWKFNPPLSPHFGGAWERLVQSVKKSLEFTLKSRIPKEEVLKTLLFEAANSVNSRPLTHVSIDKDDPEALTPNHFLLGTSGSAPTPGVFSDQDLFLRNQWRLSQRLSDIFWNRWVKEYLPTLTKRSKWNISAKPFQVSDVVIIADENNPRNLWPKGIIVATFPGKDGKIRVVEVKTCTGTYRRPVCKIIVLDVHQKESDDPQ
ncbi:unnamed protein product [Allacma fusca]|uniref:Integrase catalytic domain-containing protein n=1 Tax=Allacma fusca TaxID=39272 RepID=A0A8J2KXU5_9HEXA|nr:unnamed protein product [Allacma fusca]